MINIKVGEFLQKHIYEIIDLCKRDKDVLNNLQSSDYCSDTFGLLSRYSLINKLSDIKARGIYNRFYKNNYNIDGEEYRICSQFGGSHLIDSITASSYHGKKLLSYFTEKKILNDEFINKDIEFIVGNIERDFNIKSSLNQILYGPPGTGKTYNTINKALEIIDNIVPNSRGEAKKRFEELQKAGQIAFVTFHQSYGYEEFVEGIKAIPVGEKGNENGNEMIYKVSDGIFKELSKKAEDESILLKNDNIYKLEKYNSKIIARMKKINTNIFRVLKGSQIKKSETTSFNGLHIKEEFLKNAKYIENEFCYILEDDYDFNSISGASTIVSGASSNGNTDWKLEEEIYEQKNYIIIIDEINRGNISKIFGELITLIEPSKRIGADDEIKLRLPYSNDEFGVPQNLYIIGTMNTADRSIALMDTALRRRFDFVEMMPNLELLDFDVDGVHIKSLLSKINERVEYLYDRDHTIGHAYFLSLHVDSSLDDLNSVFENKIIPLLQEYFYDDWEKILLVLNDGFIEKNKQDYKVIFDEKMDDDYIEDDKVSYKVKEKFIKESYIKIYGKIDTIQREV